jgi:hypothetical protein
MCSLCTLFCIKDDPVITTYDKSGSTVTWTVTLLRVGNHIWYVERGLTVSCGKTFCSRSRDDVAGIMTRSRAGRCQGSNLGTVKRFFSSPEHPDRLWGPPSLLFNGYRGYFPKIKRPWRDVDHSRLAPKLRISGAIPLLPLCAITASTGTTLPYTTFIVGLRA